MWHTARIINHSLIRFANEMYAHCAYNVYGEKSHHHSSLFKHHIIVFNFMVHHCSRKWLCWNAYILYNLLRWTFDYKKPASRHIMHAHPSTHPPICKIGMLARVTPNFRKSRSSTPSPCPAHLRFLLMLCAAARMGGWMGGWMDG